MTFHGSVEDREGSRAMLAVKRWDFSAAIGQDHFRPAN